MRRRLFQIIAALGLALWVFVIVLWLRSYWVMDQVSLARDQQIVVISSSGRFFVGMTRLWTYDGSDAIDIANQPPAAPGAPLKPQAYSQRWTTEFWHSRDLRNVPTLNGGMPSGLKRWFGTTIYGFSRLGGKHLRREWGNLYYLPHWLILAALSPFAVAPVVSLAVRRRHRRRQGERRCARCGYDLRASPDRCPECGTVPERPATTAA
jgi:hypothetical protein